MEKKLKIIVAHPGRQHSFKLATALKKNQMLYKYITTVYNKPNSLTSKINRFLSEDNSKRANARVCNFLENKDVIQFCEWQGLITLLLLRIDKSLNLYRFWNDFVADYFGRKVAHYAIKNNVDAVIMYDTTALTCFKILKNKAPNIKRIMDVSAANRLYMKEIYEEDMKRCPQFSEKLYKERSFLWDESKMKRLKKELEYTELFLVPSEFVKKSLMFSGIEESMIYECPYGVNEEIIENFNDNNEDKKLNRPLEVIYVGNLTQMKGISYLLESFRDFDTNEVNLTLVGNYSKDDYLFSPYKGMYNFIGFVNREHLKKLYAKSDLLVFPSLGEGFSLSILEALGAGIPAIVTENSGANSLIRDYYNGFIIPIGDINSIREKVKWFLNNKNKIYQMKQNAVESVKNYSWENYENNVCNILKQII